MSSSFPVRTRENSGKVERSSYINRKDIMSPLRTLFRRHDPLTAVSEEEVERHSFHEKNLRTLRKVGGLCFDYLTHEVEWDGAEGSRPPLRGAFCARFAEVICDEEGNRFMLSPELCQGGSITIGEREQMHVYLRKTLRALDEVEGMEGFPPMAVLKWPRNTVIWIDFPSTGIDVKVRDPADFFGQSLKSATKRLARERRRVATASL